MLAWAESPLQLIAAVEYAAATGHEVTVLPRSSDSQHAATTDALEARGLPANCTIGRPQRVLPLLWFLRATRMRSSGSGGPAWVVGDPFSSQVRFAVAVLRPRALVIVDDGSSTLHLAGILAADGPFAREGQSEGVLKRMLGSLAKRAILRLAALGRLSVFTYYEPGRPELRALAGTGAVILTNEFGWLRSRRVPEDAASIGSRIILGTALVVDGKLEVARYLRWLSAESARGPVSYYPHRRETALTRGAAAGLHGVTVVEPHLPIELALAGRDDAVTVVSHPSSAIDTLRVLLADSGGTVVAAGEPCTDRVAPAVEPCTDRVAPAVDPAAASEEIAGIS
jgi:hypothetical protein